MSIDADCAEMFEAPMAIVIYCGKEERNSKVQSLLDMLEGATVKMYTDGYRDVKAKVHKTIRHVNILNNNFMKSERYELYLISKRYGVPYCVINFPTNDVEGACAKNRYDNPYIEGDKLDENWLHRVLGTQRSGSVAHRKVVVDAEYLSDVKKIIEAINRKHGSLFFFEEVERKMMRLLQSNPFKLDEIASSYEKLVVSEINRHNPA